MQPVATGPMAAQRLTDSTIQDDGDNLEVTEFVNSIEVGRAGTSGDKRVCHLRRQSTADPAPAVLHNAQAMKRTWRGRRNHG